MFANLTTVPEQKNSPLWLAHIPGALRRPESLPCSLPDGDGISHHESILENLTNSINGGCDRMTFFVLQKGHPEAWQGAGWDAFSVWILLP